MTTVTHEREYFELTISYWTNVVVAGLVAGVAMGLIMHEVMGTIQMVGGLYGLGTTRFGWAFHLWHAVVFAALYGGFFVWGRIEPFRERVLAGTTLGIVWGTFLWFVAAGVVMPIWLDGLGASVPVLDPWSGLGHVLYGAVVGGGSAGLHKLT